LKFVSFLKIVSMGLKTTRNLASPYETFYSLVMLSYRPMFTNASGNVCNHQKREKPSVVILYTKLTYILRILIMNVGVNSGIFQTI
ncbi:hypothetical protein CHH83_26580, partial [Bacillus sp. 7586-K]